MHRGALDKCSGIARSSPPPYQRTAMGQIAVACDLNRAECPASLPPSLDAMEQLSAQLLDHLLSFLDINEIPRLTRVSKRWHAGPVRRYLDRLSSQLAALAARWASRVAHLEQGGLPAEHPAVVRLEVAAREAVRRLESMGLRQARWLSVAGLDSADLTSVLSFFPELAAGVTVLEADAAACGMITSFGALLGSSSDTTSARHLFASVRHLSLVCTVEVAIPEEIGRALESLRVRPERKGGAAARSLRMFSADALPRCRVFTGEELCFHRAQLETLTLPVLEELTLEECQHLEVFLPRLRGASRLTRLRLRRCSGLSAAGVPLQLLGLRALRDLELIPVSTELGWWPAPPPESPADEDIVHCRAEDGTLALLDATVAGADGSSLREQRAVLRDRAAREAWWLFFLERGPSLRRLLVRGDGLTRGRLSMLTRLLGDLEDLALSDACAAASATSSPADEAQSHFSRLERLTTVSGTMPAAYSLSTQLQAPQQAPDRRRRKRKRKGR